MNPVGYFNFREDTRIEVHLVLSREGMLEERDYVRLPVSDYWEDARKRGVEHILSIRHVYEYNVDSRFSTRMALAEVVRGEVTSLLGRDGCTDPEELRSGLAELLSRVVLPERTVPAAAPSAVTDDLIESAARVAFNPELNWGDTGNLFASAVQRAYFRLGAEWAFSQRDLTVKEKR